MMADYRDHPIKDLELSGRARRVLKRVGIKTIGELMATPVDDFLKIRGIGRKNAEEIIAKLMELGLECDLTRSRQVIYGGEGRDEV